MNHNRALAEITFTGFIDRRLKKALRDEIEQPYDHYDRDDQSRYIHRENRKEFADRDLGDAPTVRSFMLYLRFTRAATLRLSEKLTFSIITVISKIIGRTD
jgi:hypothetical protein